MEHPPVGSADQKTILVVDDDPAVLTVVRAILAKMITTISSLGQGVRTA